ncbi:hypothetical protein LSAT2_001170 [Lamellibrachia satsuma]|nr:hypothetical protein LSAT2_001170 [Lamellibrachia satsuma]
MSEVVTHLLSVKNSKVISETKYDEIVEHLQRPNAVTDPKLRWWIKRKRFQLISFPELDIADVLVIPKRGGCSDMSPSDCQRAHRDYYGMPRSYVEQFYNGREFVNQVLASLFEQWVATQSLSMAGPDIRSHRDLSKEATGQ